MKLKEVISYVILVAAAPALGSVFKAYFRVRRQDPGLKDPRWKISKESAQWQTASFTSALQLMEPRPDALPMKRTSTQTWDLAF